MRVAFDAVLISLEGPPSSWIAVCHIPLVQENFELLLSLYPSLRVVVLID